MTASLHEEAAPISRRLAEVKGLSNNAIRRLERLEGLIESERNARVDDLGLLVDLLTNGWRRGRRRVPRRLRRGGAPAPAPHPPAGGARGGRAPPPPRARAPP